MDVKISFVAPGNENWFTSSSL